MYLLSPNFIISSFGDRSAQIRSLVVYSGASKGCNHRYLYRYRRRNHVDVTTAAAVPASGPQQGSGQGEAAGNQKEQPQRASRGKVLQDMIKANGPGAFLAYITASNCLSVGTLSCAWLAFTRTTGQTPLQAWPQFLACYAGVYAAQHMARPYKIAAGCAAAPLGNAALAATQRLLKVGSKAALLVLLLLEAVLLLSCLGCVILYARRMVS
jgi:hypothetical protein